MNLRRTKLSSHIYYLYTVLYAVFLQCVGQVRNVCEGKNANSTNMGVCDSLYVGVCGWPPCRGALVWRAKYGIQQLAKVHKPVYKWINAQKQPLKQQTHRL